MFSEILPDLISVGAIIVVGILTNVFVDIAIAYTTGRHKWDLVDEPTPLHYKRTMPKFTWPLFKFAYAQRGRATIIVLLAILGGIAGVFANAISGGMTLTRQQVSMLWK